MKYEKTTKQGYKIIAKGFAGIFGIIIIAERTIGDHKDYVMATGYSNQYGDWGQGHYTSRITSAIEYFGAYAEYIDWIEYKREEAE